MFAKKMLVVLMLSVTGVAHAQEAPQSALDQTLNKIKSVQAELSSTQNKDEARKKLAELEVLTEQSKKILFGTDQGQNPDSTTRLVVRSGKLRTKLVYLRSLHADLLLAQMIEDTTEELVGSGIVSAPKYAPGLAVVVPMGLVTARFGYFMAKDMVKAPLQLLSNAMNKSKTFSGRLSGLAAVPLRYTGGVFLRAIVPSLAGAATSFGAYNMYSIYMDKPEFDALLSSSRAEIASTDAEIDAIEAELKKRFDK